jgi:predicted DNA-binding protein
MSRIRILTDVAPLCYTSILRWNPHVSTTTIRLPEDLKARVAAAAERAGTTAHSFILEAIAEKADQAERRGDFHDVAEKRYADLIASGKTIPWQKMRSYLEDRIAGKTVVRPRAKKLAR